MAAVAHNPAFAKKVGVPVSVGKEFNKADKGRKFARGGEMISEHGGTEKYKSKAAMKKHEKTESPAKEVAEEAAGKAVKSHEKRMHGMKSGGYVRAADGIAKRGKTRGKIC